MKQNLKSLGLTLVTAGLFFGLLVGAQFFFKNFYIAGNFEEKLSQVEGIKKIEINDDHITLTMGKVNNLKETYQEITQVIQDKKYEILIKDLPSPILEDAAEKSEIAIYEGIYRGNFTEISDYIRNLAGENGITVKIFVDNERVYLQMEEEQNFLYRIIDRPEHALPGITG